jgi:hypothetical protein
MEGGGPRPAEEFRNAWGGSVAVIGLGALEVGQATASASPVSRSRSPCGKRALVLRAMALRIR